MPRTSAAARLVADFRRTVEPPAPPKRLSLDAKRLWKAIADAKPPDFFGPEHLPILEQYCEVVVQQRVLLARLREEPGDPTAIKGVKDLGLLSIALATKLRLTVQSALRGDSSRNREKGASDLRRWWGNLEPEGRARADQEPERGGSLLGGHALRGEH